MNNWLSARNLGLSDLGLSDLVGLNPPCGNHLCLDGLAGPLYHAHGSNIGAIECELEDDHSATLNWSTVGFPCSFCIGILEGAAARYKVKPLIEHGTGSCRDTGGSHCVYYVSW